VTKRPINFDWKLKKLFELSDTAKFLAHEKSIPVTKDKRKSANAINLNTGCLMQMGSVAWRNVFNNKNISFLSLGPLSLLLATF
jgi:hypothetical protein